MFKFSTFFVMITFICVALFQLNAQTEIPGGPVSGIWSIDNSPFHIEGDIWIEDGKTLRVDPGVIIMFEDHLRFDIQGRLLAEGSKEARISFTASQTESGWNGLRFENISVSNDTSKLIHCTIQYGYPTGFNDQQKSGGGIFIKNVDKLIVSFCEISNNRTEGNLDTGGGGLAIVNSSPIITQNLIAKNDASGGHGGGIAIIQNSNPIVNSNIIYSNEAFGGGGIAISQCSPFLFNNTLSGNFSNHGGGVDLPYGTATFVNTIFYGNYATEVGDEVHLGYLYDVNFLNCLIEGGKAAFGQNHFPGAPDFDGIYENIIDDDPEFESILGDFRLKDSSPCIGAGTEQIDLNGNTFLSPKVDQEGKYCPIPMGSNYDLGAIENLLGRPVGLNKLLNIRDDLSMNISPNPSSISSNIQFELYEPEHVTLEIFDSNGSKVLAPLNRLLQSGKHHVGWNTENLQNGSYFCLLRTQDCIIYRKIFVQH